MHGVGGGFPLTLLGILEPHRIGWQGKNSTRLRLSALLCRPAPPADRRARAEQPSMIAGSGLFRGVSSTSLSNRQRVCAAASQRASPSVGEPRRGFCNVHVDGKLSASHAVDHGFSSAWCSQSLKHPAPKSGQPNIQRSRHGLVSTAPCALDAMRCCAKPSSGARRPRTRSQRDAQ